MKKAGRRAHHGQALLLTVVLMLFVALLGVTFVTVVAFNLSNTSRYEDKNEAREAARAGIIFATRRLLDEGLRYRPKNESPPPQPGEPSFSAYYSAFEQAQDWTTSGAAKTDANYHSDGFVKYPDPRELNTGDSPVFLLKVERVRPDDADNARGDKTGDLRVVVIGRSRRNDSAYHREVRYQVGSTRHPLTAQMRAITNWDFVGQTVPTAQVANAVTNSTSVAVRNVKGRFPIVPFYVIFGSPQTKQVRGALVQSFTSAPGNGGVLTLTTPVTVPANERVEMAGALGAPPFIDYDNSGSINQTTERVRYPVSQNSSPGSVHSNGGLLWFGSVEAKNLRAKELGGTAGAIRASGLAQIMASGVSPQGTPAVSISGEYSNGGYAHHLNNAPLASHSAVVNFPGQWPGLSAQQKAQLVDDGWNRLAGNDALERQVQSFIPPDINVGSEGLNRYKRMAQSGDGGTFGWGEGIYINNLQDRERVGIAANSYREMNEAELRELWMGTSTGYTRLGSVASDKALDKSLEEQHLRGWIATDEFRARGAFIELIEESGTPKIAVTLDAAIDGAANAYDQGLNYGPNDEKSWRDANGNPIGAPGAVFRRVLDWPRNGVIYAEGNIRIKGVINNAPRSLTVVSQHNIYIEGSLKAGDRKVLLMAKKNVVANPTALVRRPYAITKLAANVSNSAVLPVYDATGFNIGDWVFADNPSSFNGDIGGCVINKTATSLTLHRPISATAGWAVRTESDVQSGTGANRHSRLERFAHVLQRRFDLADASTPLRLALRHGAERKNAIRVAYIDGANQPAALKVAHKLATNPWTGVIGTGEKFLTTTDDGFAPPIERDRFGIMGLTPGNAQSDEPTDFDLGWLAGDKPINGDRALKNRIEPSWRYADPHHNLLLPLNSRGVTYSSNYMLPNLRVPPYYFLASVGNRYRMNSAPGAWPFRPGIKTTPFYFDIPMATSVAAFVNGTSTRIGSEAWDSSSGDYQSVPCFGFNPLHGIGGATDQVEDVLTGDESFYTPYSGSTALYALDSRTFGGARIGENTFSLRLNDQQMDANPYHLVSTYFNATDDNDIPFYRLSRVKLENVTFGSARDMEALQPGQTMDIHAYVYAQDGSWIVIPGDFYDASTRNNLDLDRNGFISRSESAAAYRYARYNYQIHFTGAICENHSPPVNNSGAVRGAISDWMNKWATTRLSASNFSGAALNATSVSYANDNFGNIVYNFDDSALRGLLDDDEGFHLPISPQLVGSG